MWQQIIVYLIGVAVVVYVTVAVYRLVTRRRDPCAGCSGCVLKSKYELKRRECAEKTKVTAANDNKG